MHLVPIKEHLSENIGICNHPDCQEIIEMTVAYYQKIGFTPPWIGYLVIHSEEIVGSGGFKGKPKNGVVEIAYGTFEKSRNQGIGSQICKLLVDLSLTSDPAVIITARTLPEHNFSTKILAKNNFKYIGIVHDPEDGDVWEWHFQSAFASPHTLSD